MTSIWTSRNILPRTWRNAAILKYAENIFNGRTEDSHARLSGIKRDALATLVKDNNFEFLHDSGDVEGIARALDSHTEGGIKGDPRDLRLRQSMFGSNTYSPLQLLPKFLMESLKDITFLILLFAASLCLAIGIKRGGWKDGWHDGAAMFLLLLLVAIVTLLKKFRRAKLTEKEFGGYGKIRANVIRSGDMKQILIRNVVVGDVVQLGIGDRVPADGLFIKGNTLELDLYPEIVKESKEVVSIGIGNPFLLAHSMVVRGEADMIVTSVGLDTLPGERLGSVLPDQLDELSSWTEIIGAVITLLLLVVLLFRCFLATIHSDDDKDPDSGFYGGKTEMRETFEVARTLFMKQNLLMKKFLCIFSVFLALPPNMAVAVGFLFYHWRRRMGAIGAKARNFWSIGTMGRVRTIVIDNECVQMSKQIVTEFSLGGEALSDDLSVLPRNIRQALWQGVGLSTTGRFTPFPNNDSTAEEALLSWAELMLDMDMNELEQTCKVLHVEASDSKNKRSGMLIIKRVDRFKIYHVHWKGNARVILGMCSSYYERDGIEEDLDTRMRENFEAIIQEMEDRGLQCIALAHKQIAEDNEEERDKNMENSQKLQETGLTLLGLVGLKHFCPPQVRRAVMTCRNAGIDIKIVTKDSILTVKDLAIECGVMHNMDWNEAVITGSKFKEQSPTKRIKMLENVCAMARSTAFDEFLLVKCLKQNGHIVAVTRVGTDHKHVLKEANLRVSMRSSNSKEVEESSDIIVLDNNLTSLVAILGWGQCACNNIKKFIQLQVTMSILWLIINFVEAVSMVEVPVAALQLLWVEIFVGTIGAIALADKTPIEEIAMDPTVSRWEPLITNIMWRNILVQALYQIAVMLTLQLKGEAIFSVENEVKNALAFNTFFLCQVFNVFNARELEKKNVFKGIIQNRLFWWLMGSAVVMQEVIVRFGPSFLVTKRLNWVQWASCIGLAAVSLPVGCITKSIPVLEGPYLGLLGLLSRTAKRIPVLLRVQYMRNKLHRRWINFRSPADSLPADSLPVTGRKTS